jgi:50S ribosomal protein L16 3-hydroxylase
MAAPSVKGHTRGHGQTRFVRASTGSARRVVSRGRATLSSCRRAPIALRGDEDGRTGSRGGRAALMADATKQSPLLGGMSTARFLRDHWQKKPLLVRGAFPGFRDPLDPDELAGLACEDGVESRIVREKGGAYPWQVTWGPQEESAFAKLPKRGWTLLVQEINRWVPEAALLLEPFSFLPSVRVDDVMTSFAAPGGSVGPHVDSYDVFLIQGRGKRRWKYHTRPTKDRRILPDLDLRILEEFEAQADEVLGPGDMLYLPPNFAHHGVAVTPCLTYSIGFRSPCMGEVWSSFAGAIPEELLARIRTMVRSLDTSDEAIDRWFASFATRLKPGHELEPPRRSPDAKALFRKLERGAVLARSEEARWAFLPHTKGGLRLYVGGAELVVPAEATALAKALCASRRHPGPELLALAKGPASRELLVGLVAMGALYVLP